MTFTTILYISFDVSEGHDKLNASRSVRLNFPPFPGLRLTIPYLGRRIFYDIESVEYDMAREAFECTTVNHDEIKAEMREKFVSALKEDGWWILGG